VLRFYRDEYRGQVGKIFVESVVGVDTWAGSIGRGFFLLALTCLTHPVQKRLMSAWEGLPIWVVPVAVMAAVVVLFVRGLLKENFERFLKIHHEKTRLEERLTTEEKRRATLDLLGGYHAKGQKLLHDHPRVEEIPEATVEEISEWREGVYRLIRAAYGSGRAEIFLSGKDPDYTEEWLQERLARLVRLMEQTSELELRPDFDPEDFALQDQERGSGS
jgi:hypothetical protein